MLRDAKPPIWRRVVIDGDATLEDLHKVIQCAMGWLDYHLHQFRIGESIYGTPLPDADFEPENDEREFKLSEVLPAEGKSICYTYDFGDDWDHIVLVEKNMVSRLDVRIPVCLAGRRAAPPEDCGGIGGFWDMLEALSDRKHERYTEMMEWLGGDFDPDEFDLRYVNECIYGLFVGIGDSE